MKKPSNVKKACEEQISGKTPNPYEKYRNRYKWMLENEPVGSGKTWQSIDSQKKTNESYEYYLNKLKEEGDK